MSFYEWTDNGIVNSLIALAYFGVIMGVGVGLTLVALFADECRTRRKRQGRMTILWGRREKYPLEPGAPDQREGDTHE